MRKRNSGDLTAAEHARKQYQKQKRIKRQAKLAAALDKRAKFLVKEIARLTQKNKELELQLAEKKDESKG